MTTTASHKEVIVLVSLASLWFVSMAGGWSDIGNLVAAKLSARPTSELTNEESLARGAILVEGDELGMPTHLVVAGDELWVVDRYREEAVLALDRHLGQVLRSFGPAGEGPGEFKGPVSLVADGLSVAVLDASLNRITWLDTEGGTEAFTLAATAQIALESVVTDFVITSDRQFLVAGFLGSHRLAKLDRQGRFVGYSGEPVQLGGLPSDRISEVFQGSLRSNASGTRHVLTGRFTSRIDVLDQSTSTTITAWGPTRFEPRQGKYESRFGYLDSAPMSDGFLALFSGRTRPEYPGRANYAATVHDFGWDGQLRGTYRLDADVITIAWSEHDNRLYAIRHDPVPAILVYTLDR